MNKKLSSYLFSNWPFLSLTTILVAGNVWVWGLMPIIRNTLDFIGTKIESIITLIFAGALVWFARKQHSTNQKNIELQQAFVEMEKTNIKIALFNNRIKLYETLQDLTTKATSDSFMNYPILWEIINEINKSYYFFPLNSDIINTTELFKAKVKNLEAMKLSYTQLKNSIHQDQIEKSQQIYDEICRIQNELVNDLHSIKTIIENYLRIV